MATLGTLCAADRLNPGSLWQLETDVNGYARSVGHGLATQAQQGRRLRILEAKGPRLRVELLEDGYHCWMDPEDLVGKAHSSAPWQPPTKPARAPATATLRAQTRRNPNYRA